MGSARDGDVLDRWLSGEGLATLDHLTGEALDVVGVVDRELVVRYVNWTAPGLTREGVVGGNVVDIVPPDYRDLSREVYQRVLRTGVGARFETNYRDEHGVLIWVVRVGPIRHEGEVIGLLTISTDVTEQRREYADRDRFFSLSLDMLIVARPDGRLKRVNPAFGKTLGYQLSELVETPFVDLVHPDDRVRTMATFEALLRGDPLTDFENRYRRKDGAERVFSWRATADPLTGDVYAVARDITDQRAAEAQLRHAQKMEAVGRLAGGVAHDFNNLMQAVLANAELALAKAAPSSNVSEYLHEIADAGRRAADLTKQLLVFSRLQPLHRVRIDLNDLLQSLMNLLRRLLPENIAIDLRAGRPLASVNADQTQLEQVIINLCINARDAMESGGKLTIETDNTVFDERDCERLPRARPGPFVRLRVTDTGAGMTPKVLERIFDPFFTTKGNQRGTGLGLATVYGIAEQHGGLVHVESEVGHGTTFRVYLPADDRPANATDAAGASAPTDLRGHETILVAEDEALVRRPVLQVLERAGYRTLAASSGLEAIRILREHEQTVALVILDVVMPEMGGPEAWDRLRAIRPDLRVIFVSGYASERYRSRLPPDADVLEKPFDGEELLRRIRRKLDE
jgi:two-component system, cell cycle sensor histidine kinase and response regulator CckA